MADREYRLDQVLAPFDFEESPSMSSQMIAAAPSVFGAEDPTLLQTANRVMLGGPLDIFDLATRAGDTAMRGVSEGVEYVSGLPGIRRDIYNLLTVGGLMAGTSPSPASLRTSRPSTGKSAPQSSTPDSGIMKALPAPEPKKALPAPKNQGIMIDDPEAITGEIVSGPSDKYLRLVSEKDKALSAARRDQLDEEMVEEALGDAFSDVVGYMDDEIDTLIDRGVDLEFTPSYSIGNTRPDFGRRFGDNSISDFYDDLQDGVIADVMDGKPMGDSLLTRLKDRIDYYSAENDIMDLFDADEIIRRMAPKLNEYGYDILSDVKRVRSGRASQQAMKDRKRRAESANRPDAPSLVEQLGMNPDDIGTPEFQREFNKRVGFFADPPKDVPLGDWDPVLGKQISKMTKREKELYDADRAELERDMRQREAEDRRSNFTIVEIEDGE